MFEYRRKQTTETEFFVEQAITGYPNANRPFLGSHCILTTSLFFFLVHLLSRPIKSISNAFDILALANFLFFFSFLFQNKMPRYIAPLSGATLRETSLRGHYKCIVRVWS